MRVVSQDELDHLPWDEPAQEKPPFHRFVTLNGRRRRWSRPVVSWGAGSHAPARVFGPANVFGSMMATLTPPTANAAPSRVVVVAG